jgi:two-component system, cell cycle sensor histidine kinase and response regulator CckA
MPDITGIELAKKMMEARRDIPVILFTGYSETVSSETAHDAGIGEFLMTPIEKTTLTGAVRRVLDNRRQESPSGR